MVDQSSSSAYMFKIEFPSNSNIHNRHAISWMFTSRWRWLRKIATRKSTVPATTGWMYHLRLPKMWRICYRTKKWGSLLLKKRNFFWLSNEEMLLQFEGKIYSVIVRYTTAVPYRTANWLDAKIWIILVSYDPSWWILLRVNDRFDKRRRQVYRRGCPHGRLISHLSR